jgi:hypothetical protein
MIITNQDVIDRVNAIDIRSDFIFKGIDIQSRTNQTYLVEGYTSFYIEDEEFDLRFYTKIIEGKIVMKSFECDYISIIEYGNELFEDMDNSDKKFAENKLLNRILHDIEDVIKVQIQNKLRKKLYNISI